jgi:two-component system osmolarity sensor histidine kinase EnvZ
MFYGLSKLIKKILPRQLFYRGLLIVATPIIILQVTISIVFFDSLWIKTNKGMTNALVNEVRTFIDAYDNDENNKDYIIVMFKDYLKFNIKYEENKEIPKLNNERWFSPIDRSLRRELKSQNLTYSFDTSSYVNLIDLKVKYKNGYFQFFIPRERLTNSSVRLFALWITIPAFLVIGIAIIFLKNQTRPIIKLAEASERFGRGEDVEEYSPSGALEIRKAGYEFERMRKRILKHLNQRSEMLSGISHDLRTPLTRIKLQMEIIKDENIKKKLSDDIDEMEKMLNEYLQFSKSTFTEKNEKFEIVELITLLVKKYNLKNISLEKSEEAIFNGRKNLIQRCLSNLIDNALKFGENVKINQFILKKKIIISIEDDGPGIPKSEFENVFKPFYKIDKSRNKAKSSVGLGLSIASDIIKSHGGEIELNKSEIGGLKVKISLPI